MRHLHFKKKIIGISIVGMIVISFSFQSKFFEVAKQLEIYTTLFKELNMYYIDEINPAEFTTKAIKNTLKELDPYTNFFNEQEVEDARIAREGEYGGIGISAKYTSKGIVIAEIYKGFSADKAGLIAGDLITNIDGQSLQNMKRDQLSLYLKGIPNSVFKITIERQGTSFTKDIIRDKVIINPVPFAKMMDEETGYITLTRFNEKASSEVKKAFRKLKKQGMKKLVFDVRGNPGGSLREAIRICNFFLPKGSVIVTTKAKIKKWSTIYKATEKAIDLEIPIVVLVDGKSASASEIVSGALQDYDRAVVMGERSFGKGLVQRYRELTYGTQLKVTISKYYTPSGRCIQELDYANRDEDGNVPKFSDSGVHKFTTKNGRIVFDGGGVLPDVIVGYSKKTKETETLLKSNALFNYATDFYAANKSIKNLNTFTFSDTDFKNFKNYLKTDTTFVTEQEHLFKKANASLDKMKLIDKEYSQILKKLQEHKLSKISTNKAFLKILLKEEILKRYFYQEGVYQHKLKNDKVIEEAFKLLNNFKKYQELITPK